jgi:lysophospholipase L1-like esterase
MLISPLDRRKYRSRKSRGGSSGKKADRTDRFGGLGRQSAAPRVEVSSAGSATDLVVWRTDTWMSLTQEGGMKRRKRLVALLLIGAGLIAGAAAYVEFHFHLPVGTGPAGPAMPGEPFQRPWSQRTVVLLGVGDSVTAGFGATRGHSYFDRLAANPADEFEDMRGRSLSAVLPNLMTRNMAVSGSNSLQHARVVAEKLEKQSDDVFGLVVMTSGGNDLIHWYGRSPPREGAMYGATPQQAEPWVANFEKRLDEVFAALEARFPGGCRIFIADIYDPSDGRGDPETAGLPAWPDVIAVHAAYNDALRQAAGRHASVRVVPMYQAFLGHGIHCRKFWGAHYRASDPHYWYAPNLEDPNDRGYDAIRRAFLNEILKEVAVLQ